MSLRLRAFFFAWVCFMILGFVALRRVALGCVWFYVFFCFGFVVSGFGLRCYILCSLFLDLGL